MTLCDRVAHLFQSKPDRWIDGREFAALGGYAAWRSRISDLRRPPYQMTIENRVRRIKSSLGTNFVVTEYRFVSEKKIALEGKIDYKEQRPEDVNLEPRSSEGNL